MTEQDRILAANQKLATAKSISELQSIDLARSIDVVAAMYKYFEERFKKYQSVEHLCRMSTQLDIPADTLLKVYDWYAKEMQNCLRSIKEMVYTYGSKEVKQRFEDNG